MDLDELRSYPFSFKLRYLRAEKGLTVKEFCKGVGCGVSTYTYWNSGKSNPSFEYLTRIAKFFDVPLDLFASPMEMMKFRKNQK